MSDVTPPYVVAAFFCERVLREKDEVSTIVRIVDRLFQSVRLPPGAPQEVTELLQRRVQVDLTFFVCIWGSEPGKHALRISYAYEGDSSTIDLHSSQIELTEARMGMNFAIGLHELPRAGRIWAEVKIDGEVRTRSPLVVSQIVEATPLQTQTK